MRSKGERWMELLEDLIALARTVDAHAFAQSQPGPYLLRERTEEEIRSGPSRAVGLTLMPGQVQAVDPSALPEILAGLEESADLVERFELHVLLKSQRNVFPNGVTLGRAQNNDVVVPLAS